jgi:probable HAF family extracellular repeat protein
MVRLPTALCVAVFLCSVSPHATAADLRYRLTDLGDLTSDRMHGVTFVSGLNDKGEIVGQSFNNQFRARAFLWQSGRMIDLGDLGSLGGQPPTLAAFAVNRHSEVVGTAMGSVSPSPTRAFYWRRGRILDLGTLRSSGTDTFATSINSRGDIVGAGYRSPGDLRALRWVRGVPVEIGTLPDGRAAVQAFGISDRGEVVGYLSPGGTVSFAHAFIWKAGKFTDLGTLPGTNLSFANAVNERGQVVGQSLNTNAPGTARAFLWEAGTLLDLGKAAPAHRSSEARAINKRGTVVGTSGAGAAAVAWIWREGITRDLNKLIAADDRSQSFVQLVKANGINDRDEIVAQGYDRRRGNAAVRGYLLSPVDENQNDEGRWRAFTH